VHSKLLFLTGFMGSGKSTVGRRLARSLGIPFIDLDAEVVKSAGRSVNEIFSHDGEAAFRALEKKELSLVCRRGDCAVVATGGGVVVDVENRQMMREAGLIVNLQVDFATVSERLAGDATRPLLQTNTAEVQKLMATREAVYCEADLRVNTAHKSPLAVVSEIMEWLQHDNR
jgi:shikimate kinase